MVPYLVWFGVIVLGAAGVLLAIELSIESRWAVSAGDRSRIGSAILGIVALVVLALLWRIHALARADGRVVVELSHARSSELAAVMSVVTTMGDAVPSLVIATGLALVIFRQGRHHAMVLLMPLAVVAEVAIQIGMTKVFHDVTVLRVAPQVVDGGVGTIPSGSVARLLAVVLIAGHLWRSHDDRGATRLVTIGGVAVVVQLTTRLYLGRHLLADIVGGLLLGIVLERIAAMVIARRAPIGAAAAGSPPQLRRHAA